MQIIQDLQYAFRQLRHSPEFTVLAVVTLALGIGANAAMFTVVESVLLRPLPYTDADRLLSVGVTGGEYPGSVAWLDYQDIREQAHTLSEVAAYSNDVGVVQSKDASISVVTSEVTPNLFGMVGAQPLRGQLFGKDNARSVLISEGLWRKAFNGDPNVAGTSVRVNGQDRTVAGVMPRSFRFPEAAGHDIENGIWLPMLPTAERLKDRDYHSLMILAKRAPEASLTQVDGELGLIAARIRNADPKVDRKMSLRGVPYLETVTGPVRAVFVDLVAALGLVLLIACANLANLLIARCMGRRHEFAVRAALGSGQGRLVGQMITEAGVLSFLGCGLGVLVANWITAAIHNLPPALIPRAETIEIHWTVLLVLALIATATTVLAALVPALFAARTDPQAVLQAASRSLGTKSVRARAGGWMVAGEVALSALLLIATGLLFRTLWGLEHTRLGFETTSVTSFAAMPADSTGFGNVSKSPVDGAVVSVARTVYQPLLEGMRQAPGVRDAVLVTAPPFSGIDLKMSFHVVGAPSETGDGPEARTTAVSSGYERLMRTPLLQGRSISEQDSVNAPFVAVVNQTLVQKYFGGRNALGQQLDLGGETTGMVKPYTIVGVAGDQTDTGTSRPPQPLLMLPYQQIPPSSLFYPALLKTMVHFVIKTHGDVAVAPAARAVFHRIAPDLALDNFQTMHEKVEQSNFGTRLGLYLIGAFAALAVVMVIAGLYGVLSQVVNHRRREFGVRMALGATRQSIVRMVLLQGAGIVGIGLAVGMTLAVSMGQMIQGFLFGVKPLDAATYVFVAAALLGIGVLAALLPAWRAACFEPVDALRDE